MVSEDRKCSKPGCGALSILGKACLDRDCPQTWVHYTAHNAEIDSLTRELAEARDKALNEVIRYHDNEIERLKAQIAENTEYCKRRGVPVSEANAFCHDAKAFHTIAISEIRALKEKP